jgi:hypothetical protein
MMLVLSRTLMALAAGSLGESRRDWALAMESEFEVAVDEGAPLAFAAGCLTAAWREMPHYAEGRLAMANHALALGLLIPMAVLLFGDVALLPWLLTGRADGSLTAAVNVSPYVAWSRLDAVPMLLMLWLLLGMAHLGLAWAVVERDWPRVVKIAALIGAALLTLVVLTAMLLLDLGSLAPQAAAIAAELGVITVVARSHTRLLCGTSSDLIAS